MLTVDNDVENDNQAIHRVFRSEQTRSVQWTHVCGRSSVEKACVEKKFGKKNCNKSDHVGAMCKNMKHMLR
jgi:ribosomal protein L4